jgi:hypothetical protein
MWHGMRRRALAGIVALAGTAALAPAASAAISPSMSVTTPTPVAAGATANLGLDLKFNPSGGDAPDQVVLNLPPGVLANASVAGGSCLKVAPGAGFDFSDPSQIDPACQIGSGTVNANAFGTVPVPGLGVDFYLVAPPAPGDLAGLAVASTTGDQIGTTDAILIRPSGSPAGVGVTLDLTLPNSLGGAPISVTEINSTFNGTRMPATCPATAANITLSANSYNATQTNTTASAPLPVSGCAGIAYAPKYALTATRDAGDKMVKLATTITQSATESPNSSVSLAFPLATVAPAITGLGALCSDPTSGKCTPVGSVTAQSPDYPAALTGQAYLTGTITGLTLTLIFPAPFPLTLVGTVDLKDNVTTFTGLPDIPLTSLAVTLNSGKSGLFSTSCATPSGTSTATLTDQNGDKSAKVPAQFTVSGCPTRNGSGSGSGSGSGAGSGSGSGSGTSVTAARPHVTTTRVKGLKSGKPSLSFKVKAAKKSSLRSLTVTLPKGLSFRSHKVHKHAVVKGLAVKGARLKSATLTHGRLVITLRKPAKAVTVTVRSAGLKESAALRAKAGATSAAKRLKSLKLTVVARNPKGKRTTIHVSVKHLGL